MNLGKNKKGNGIAAAIIALAIIFFMLYKSNIIFKPYSLININGQILNIPNITTSFLGGSSGTSNFAGYTTVSISQIQGGANLATGMNGKYWLAQVLLNGNSQNLQISASASQFASSINSSLLGNGNDQVTFKINQNLIFYPPNPSSITIVSNYYLQPYYGTVQYTDCNGNVQYPAGSQPINNNCLFGNNQQAYQNYFNSCSALNTQNIPVVVANGTGASLSEYIQYGLLALAFNTGSQVECYQLITKPYAQVVNLGSPIILQNVTASLNNIPLTVSNYNQVASHYNASGAVDFQIRLLYPSQTFSLVPASTNIGTIMQYISNTSGQNTGSSILLDYNSQTGLTGAITTQQNNIKYLLSNKQSIYLPTLQNYIYTYINPNIDGYLFKASVYNNNPNIQTIFNGSNSYVILQGNNFIQPQLQIISGFPFMGIYFASASCGISSTNAPKFAGSGTFNVTVVNSGTAGSCSASFINITNGYYTTTSQQNAYLTNGQSQTFYFQVFSNNYHNYSIPFTGTFNICSSVTGTNCLQKTVSSSSQACPANATVINGNTCQPLSPAPHACNGGQTWNGTACQCPAKQTLVNGICASSSSCTLPQILNANGQCISPPPCIGAGCNPGPSYYCTSSYQVTTKQTNITALYNATSGTWLCIAPSPNLGIGWIIIAVIIIIIILTISGKFGRGSKGSSIAYTSGKSVGRPRDSSRPYSKDNPNSKLYGR